MCNLFFLFFNYRNNTSPREYIFAKFRFSAWQQTVAHLDYSQEYACASSFYE